MKYRKYIILALVLVSGLFSCQRDEDIAIAILNINSEVIEPSYTSADVECYVECNTKFDNVVVEYASSEDFADAQSATMSEKDGKYHAKCVNLLDDTTYYIRYVVSNRLSSMTYKEISSFRTLTPSIPVVHMDSISNIWDVKADAFAHVEFDGGSPLSEWGITIWTDETTDTLRIKTESQEQCLIQIQDLQPNRIYNARAYAINKVGVAYSEEYEFTTYALPEIKTEEITDIQLTTALLNGILVFNGNDTAAIKGFCWSTNDAPTLENSYVDIDTTSETYTYRLSNLIDETQYYVRAYAQNKIGIVYGETNSFTTQSAVIPTVSTNEVTNVEYHTATIAADVMSNGGANVTERGICYSTTENPTIESNKMVSGKGTGSYTANLTGLQDSTTYYVRAYATNKKGIAYGEQVSFMTKGYMLPAITTANPTNIEYHSATVGGNISSDGGAEVTERGICYSTIENPTIESTKIVSGKGTGSYTANLTGLQDSTTYYVRAYAINKKGVAYGEQMSFMTKGYKLPTITTSEPTNVSYTSASVGGTLSSDGGLEVTECGICYSTQENPTIEHTKVTSGKGLGEFSINLDKLTDSVTYYVRAYAINKKGVAYGEQMSFMTKGYKLPTITTSEPTNVSYTSASVGGNALNDGGLEITERGICYSVLENPTVNNIKKSSSGGKGEYSILINDLTSNTTYYARAYATNKKGTSYGKQVTFTTLEFQLPTVVTSLATQITSSSALVGGNVTSNGGLSVIERGICYAKTNLPTIMNNQIKIGEGLGDFYIDLTNLQASVTYYVRAYAINNLGDIVYGNEVTFTTLSTSPEYIDLGLSVMWATFNLGASNPEDFGNYFAWGETSPRTENDYGWGKYKYDNGISLENLTKYCHIGKYGNGSYTDFRGTLEPCDDAAHMLWGDNWRIPTQSDWIELYCNCTWEQITQNGILGYKVTGINGNSVFLPAAGMRNQNYGENLNYWSSSVCEKNPQLAYGIWSWNEGIVWFESRRWRPMPIRPVYMIDSRVILSTLVTTINKTSAIVGGNITFEDKLSVSECGVVYSTQPNPTTADYSVRSSRTNGDFSCTLNGLNVGTTYYARTYAITANGVEYGPERSFATISVYSNYYEYVDLGLSVKWADRNLGATAPEEVGDLYAWGETETKDDFSYSNYKYCISSTKFTKYCMDKSQYNDYFADFKTTLEYSDDAAHVNLGGKWRMPTESEWAELKYNCTWEWSTTNGVKGYKITSNKNNNSIFLPSNRNGSYGFYWSSELSTFGDGYAKKLYFNWNDNSIDCANSDNRIQGLSIRPVYDE